MKYLKEYYNYDKEVARICWRYNIRNWSIRDGLVDVNENVSLSYKKLSKIPLKFGTISGHFSCSNNQLTTLEGGPIEVGGNFYCNNNQLTTLEGGPSQVGGNFYCNNNQLTTLEGGPIVVGGHFDCSYNYLTNLKGVPKEIVGILDCQSNKLNTLKYFPKRVGSIIVIYDNEIPVEIKDNQKYLNKIIEWQDEYDIWRDGKLYLPRFRDLMIDIKEGL